MGAPILLPPERHWVCPNCTQTAITRRADAHTEFHLCRGLRGLNAPMVLDGTRAHVVTVERGDWVGGDDVQLDAEGRPVMAIQTLREDGYDTAVLAPCATADLHY